MVRVGITGGIGSGKSTVCEIWRTLGAYVLYADDLAKELMVSDDTLRSQIIDTFGESAYHSDGSLNRAYLSKEAFEKGRVEVLNQLVHPRVHEQTKQEMDKAEELGYRFFVKEAALLLKEGRPDQLDVVCIVLAPKKSRIKRVMERDQATRAEVEARMAKQQDFEALLPLADYHLRNDGSAEKLHKKAKLLYKQIRLEHDED